MNPFLNWYRGYSASQLREKLTHLEDGGIRNPPRADWPLHREAIAYALLYARET